MADRKAGQGSNWLPKPTRFALYHRDGFACQYCGAEKSETVKITIDHYIAVSVGGSDKASNLLTVCGSCNSSKCDRDIAEFLVSLKKRGVDVSGLLPRIEKQLKKELDKAEGIRLEELDAKAAGRLSYSEKNRAKYERRKAAKEAQVQA